MFGRRKIKILEDEIKNLKEQIYALNNKTNIYIYKESPHLWCQSPEYAPIHEVVQSILHHLKLKVSRKRATNGFIFVEEDKDT